MLRRTSKSFFNGYMSFIKTKTYQFCSINNVDTTIITPIKNNDLNMEMTPRKIMEYLDNYIVGQKEAKKAVAIALSLSIINSAFIKLC